MFTRCIFCHRDLPTNETVENFPVGRQIAFDPGRGRLWAVCPACRRWNLAPIEERWEALEELEKLTRDRARLLSKTDNIALFRAGEIELVRVGSAQLQEEAWWRYGRELVRRRRIYTALTAAGTAAVIGAVAGGAAAGVGIFGGWWMFGRAGRALPKLTRTLKFGRTAWSGSAACPSCGATLTSIRFRDRGGLVALPDGEEGVAVAMGCMNCDYGSATRYRRDLRRELRRIEHPRRGRRSGAGPIAADRHLGEESGYVIRGIEAEHLLRRTLAYHHYSGARENQVRDATRLIQETGSATELTRRIASRGTRLSRIGTTESFAFEIAVNEESERRLLELELAALEERWQEEEELAAIVDRELTWVPSFLGLKSRLSGTGAAG